MDNSSIDSFKEKLDIEYTWPALYMFKFIVPQDKAIEIKNIFVGHEIREKASKNGNYISVTAEVMAESSDKVVEFYIAASKVEGVIAL